VLGILTPFLVFTGLLSFILAAITSWMVEKDLMRTRTGQIDPNGEGQARKAAILARVAVMVTVFGFFAAWALCMCLWTWPLYHGF
jgi:hypothetical protein